MLVLPSTLPTGHTPGSPRHPRGRHIGEVAMRQPRTGVTCRLQPHSGLRPSVLRDELRGRAHSESALEVSAAAAPVYCSVDTHCLPSEQGKHSPALERYLISPGSSKALLARGCSRLCDSGLRHTCRNMDNPRPCATGREPWASDALHRPERGEDTSRGDGVLRRRVALLEVDG